MLGTIVVGVDFTACSEVAARQALAIARRNGGRVVLAHAAAMPEAPEGVPNSMHAVADAYLQRLRARVTDDHKALIEEAARLSGQGAEVTQVLVDGFADDALVNAAHELAADLLVVGSHGRRGLDRLLVGSVAERVARSASCSVLVARGARDTADRGFQRAVIGTDFSPGAERALDVGLSMVADGAVVDVVHHWHLPIVPRSHGAEVVDEDYGHIRDATDAHARARLDELIAGRDTSRGVVRATVREGDARDGLLELARTAGADLAVVGSHGRRGLRRLLLGSVADAVVRHAPCSVLVAR